MGDVKRQLCPHPLAPASAAPRPDKLLDFLKRLDRKVTIEVSCHQGRQLYQQVTFSPWCEVLLSARRFRSRRRLRLLGMRKAFESIRRATSWLYGVAKHLVISSTALCGNRASGPKFRRALRKIGMNQPGGQAGRPTPRRTPPASAASVRPAPRAPRRARHRSIRRRSGRRRRYLRGGR